MNKHERVLKGKAKFKKRLNDRGITDKLLAEYKRKGVKFNFNCYRTTGQPCSCRMCSPGKQGEKNKYKVKYKNKVYE